jgi:tetratricopeptide (TPR) repeat protein
MAFAKAQLEVGRCVGRKDYDGAIRTLEGTLSNTSADAPSLTMIALCYRWSNRNDDAIITGQRVLEYDPTNFDAAQLLSEIYAERKEHEPAARFARLGLDNFPEPTPAPPKFILWILRIGALVIPRLRRVEESVRRDLADPEKSKREWYLWAKQYLAWYDSAFGNNQTPTVH